MDKHKIIVEAVEKAQANGYKHFINGEEATLGTKNGYGLRIYWKTENYPKPEGFFVSHVNDIIFNHAFAKALWGEGGSPGEFTGEYPNPKQKKNFNSGHQRGWQHHLQQMVIAEDPLKYLKENI